MATRSKVQFVEIQRICTGTTALAPLAPLAPLTTQREPEPEPESEAHLGLQDVGCPGCPALPRLAHNLLLASLHCSSFFVDLLRAPELPDPTVFQVFLCHWYW